MPEYSYAVRVGEARPSQLLWSFGVGAIIDLPNISVIVGGLEDWREDQAELVTESRLLAGVRKVVGPQVSRLLAPPVPPPTFRAYDPFSEEARVGVPVLPFPQYLRCPGCKVLAAVDSQLFELKPDKFRPDKTRYVHINCNVWNMPTAVPARFLVACRAGHLDDFPWRYFVHRGPTTCRGTLRFFERGASLETADLWVSCTGTCDSPARTMADAFGDTALESLPKCRGRRPHLRDFEQRCDQQLRAILLGASNSWFPVLMSALSVPTEAGELEQVIGDHWDAFSQVSKGQVALVVQTLNSVNKALPLAKYEVSEVWAAIEASRALAEGQDQPEAEVDFKGPEWEAFTNPNPKAGPDFKLRRVGVPAHHGERIAEVVLAERLREVNALIGFSRVEPPDQTTTGQVPVDRAPLSRSAPTWVPAVEVRGEGIFLRFDADRLAQWEAEAGVEDRAAELYAGHVVWRAARRLDGAGFPGVRFVMLHSLAHLVMQELSLECGYGAAAIRERIYARPVDPAMAGILLYTAAPDSEGTLGGLVAMGEPDSLQPLLDQALVRASNCASDPLCAEHDCSRDRSLHGAACHACLFAPETSCEIGNRYLDRALVVPTFQNAKAAFFDLQFA